MNLFVKNPIMTDIKTQAAIVKNSIFDFLNLKLSTLNAADRLIMYGPP